MGGFWISRKLKLLGMCVFLLYGWASGQSTRIDYQVDQLAGNRWEYSYSVTNLNLPELQEFTIWFDYGKYDNLALTNSIPTSGFGTWDLLLIQPESVIHDDGYLDALALETLGQPVTGVGPGQTVGGFSMQFDWLGAGIPGPQQYEIINPQNYQTIASGITVPEPISAILLLAGIFSCRKYRRGSGL